MASKTLLGVTAVFGRSFLDHKVASTNPLSLIPALDPSPDPCGIAVTADVQNHPIPNGKGCCTATGPNPPASPPAVLLHEEIPE